VSFYEEGRTRAGLPGTDTAYTLRAFKLQDNSLITIPRYRINEIVFYRRYARQAAKPCLRLSRLLPCKLWIHVVVQSSPDYPHYKYYNPVFPRESANLQPESQENIKRRNCVYDINRYRETNNAKQKRIFLGKKNKDKVKCFQGLRTPKKKGANKIYLARSTTVPKVPRYPS